MFSEQLRSALEHLFWLSPRCLFSISCSVTTHKCLGLQCHIKGKHSKKKVLQFIVLFIICLPFFNGIVSFSHVLFGCQGPHSFLTPVNVIKLNFKWFNYSIYSNRVPQVSYQQNTLISQCNMGCSCSLKHWDPICASNGLTYASPCLAGCQSSTGDGKDMVSSSFQTSTCLLLNQFCQQTSIHL